MNLKIVAFYYLVNLVLSFMKTGPDGPKTNFYRKFIFSQKYKLHHQTTL